MSSNKKNLLVGATVLLGLVLLGWMILKFGNLVARPFAAAQLPVELISDRADGISEGAPVYYRGISVGQVSRLSMSPDQLHVLIETRLDASPPIPANVEGVIRPQGFIAPGAAVNLELTGPKPEGRLGPGPRFAARSVGTDLLPKEFSDLASDLRLTSQKLRESGLIDHLDQAVVTVQKTVGKAGDVLDSLQGFVADPKMRKDLQETVANFRVTTETATHIAANLEKFSGGLDKLSGDASATINQARSTIAKTEGHIDNLSKQLGDRLLQVSKLLDSFQSISTKIDKGQGTAGLMVNDPKLYQALVDTSRELSLTITDLKRLVEQWEQEGVALKLK